MLFLAGGGDLPARRRLASRDGGRRDLDRSVLSAVVHRRRAGSRPLHLLQGRQPAAGMSAVVIDGDRLQRWIDELAGFSEAPAPAVTRVLFSDVDLAARAWVKARMLEAGLEVRDDAVGNIFARWRGVADGAPAVATGSHIDAIPNAGRYDGVVGVLGAIAAVQRPARIGLPALPIDRDRGLHGGGADAFRARLPGQPPALRDAFARTGGVARRRKRAHARRVAGSRGCSGGRARDRPAPARTLCRVRRAAHRAGPAARAVRRADWRRHGDRGPEQLPAAR